MIVGSGFAYYLSQKKINNSIITQSYLVYIFFCINFSLSIGLFGLMMQEIIYFKNKKDSFQEKLWQFEIKILNFNILLLGPVLMIFYINKQIKYQKIRFYSTFISLLIYFYILGYLLLREASEMKLFKNRNGILQIIGKLVSKEVQFNFMIRVGGLIISFLSGYGAICIPLNCFNFIDEESLKVHNERIKESISLCLNQIRYEKLQFSKKMKIKQNQKSSFFGKLFSSNKNDKKQIENNIQIYQNTLEDNYGDYLELKREFDKIQQKKKNPYLFFINKYLAIIFIIISCQRIFQTTFTLFMGRSNKRNDPIVTLISLVLKIFKIEIKKETYDSFLDNIYFIFYGILIVVNMRGFIQNFLRFLKVFFKSCFSQFVSSEFLLLISTQLVGLYFVCSFYLIVSKLPDKYSVNVQRFVNDLDFVQIFDSLDIAFLISCLFFIVVFFWLKMVSKYKYQIEKRKQKLI